MIATVAFDVVSNKQIAPRVNHIALKLADGGLFNFIPGQFITIHFEKDGQTLRRSYSIASIPGVDQTIDFAASYVQDGPGSEYLFALKPGDQVQVSGPFGRLVLKDEALQRIFLVATGTGITPYRAMLPALTEKIRQNSNLKVFIIQGVQYRQDVLYADDFLKWAQQLPQQAEYRSYLSREDLSQQRQPHEFAGYVQTCFDSLQVVPNEEVVYLCGNPNMIDQAFAQLQAKGLATSQIRREKYISSK